HHLHLAAEQIDQRGAAAAVADAHKVEAGHELEQLAGDVRHAAVARRCHVDLAGIGLRVGDELGNGFGRHARIDHHDLGYAHDAGNRRNVANEIETEI